MDAQEEVVGGGPVGLGWAIDRGQPGVRKAVVERRRCSAPIP